MAIVCASFAFKLDLLCVATDGEKGEMLDFTPPQPRLRLFLALEVFLYRNFASLVVMA